MTTTKNSTMPTYQPAALVAMAGTHGYIVQRGTRVVARFEQESEAAAFCAQSARIAELEGALRTLVASLEWEEQRSGTTYNGFDTARALLAKGGE